MADHFKQSRPHVVVEILGWEFLLSRPGEPGAHFGGEFISGIGRDRMNQHFQVPPSIISRSSAAYAAKTRIHILIMRLEPVTKRGPQHARSGTRRAALHDEMLAIKEISRVSPVERKGLETWKWTENGGGPFPPVAQHIA